MFSLYSTLMMISFSVSHVIIYFTKTNNRTPIYTSENSIFFAVLEVYQKKIFNSYF